MELMAYRAYVNPELEIRYWRTSTGFEVDFIIGDMDVAIEVKGAGRIHEGHIRGLKALREENAVRRQIVVSREDHPRIMQPGIEIQSWRYFLETLWSGELGV